MRDYLTENRRKGLKYWTYAVVRGNDLNGLFDMLRYDSAELVVDRIFHPEYNRVFV